ncbi:TPA: hypothetical protein ACH3X1_006163 [Trebouxia sp. C0004]
MSKSLHAPKLGRAGPKLLSYPLPRHLSLPAKLSFHTRGLANTPAACKEQGMQAGIPSFTLALAVAPLLIPLTALCQPLEQSTIADLSSASPEVVSLVSSTLAIPVVIFGAVSLIQQARQANEDKALRLKAINTHNSFLSQEEDTLDEPLVHPATNLVLNSNGTPDSSPSTSQSSVDTAAPAMLEQPDRPEPGMPHPPHSSSPDQSSKDKSSSHLPPQTAVLDRPERPEPDSASLDSAVSAQSDMTTQQTEPPFSSFMASMQMLDRPYSPRTNKKVAALQAEYETKMKSLKGLKETARPLTRPQKHGDQAEGMAAEYAAKLAMLHEESAARAEGDLRKKQKRYAMLADLQSQAQVCLCWCGFLQSILTVGSIIAGLCLSKTDCKTRNLIRGHDSFRLRCDDLCIAAGTCKPNSCAPISACQLAVLCSADERGKAVILLPAMWIAIQAHRFAWFLSLQMSRPPPASEVQSSQQTDNKVLSMVLMCLVPPSCTGPPGLLHTSVLPAHTL